MSQYIHLSIGSEGNEDSLKKVKKYIQHILNMDEDKTRSNEFARDYEVATTGENGQVDLPQTIDLLFSHADVLMRLPDEKNKEIDGCFSLLISLLQFIEDDKKTCELSETLSTVLVKDKNHPNLRLKLLMCLYNIWSPTFPVRFPIFEKIVTFAFEAGLYDQTLPYIKMLEDWQLDWNLDGEQELRLYKMVATHLRSLDRREMAYEYLYKYLAIYQTAPQEYLPETETEAMLILKDALALPKVFEVDSILSLSAVKFLGQKHPVLFELMNIFRSASRPSALVEFKKKHPTVFTDYEVDYDVLLEKLRLLSLSSFAQDKEEIELTVCAKEMGESVDEVEKWMVKAIAEGVVEGRIDQLRKTVKIKSTLHRTFGQPQWEKLETYCLKWLENIKTLRAMAAKQQSLLAPGGIAFEAAARAC